MKLLAFAASSSTTSINKQLVEYAKTLIDDGLIPDATVEILDLNDYEMPIYSTDRQAATGIPQLAQDFYDKIGRADAVLISFAEHNGFTTAAYKNIFDWASRINMAVYQGKPAVLFATSPGSSGAGNVLKTAESSGQFFGYDVLSSLSIPRFFENFDPETGTITTPEIDEQFRAALRTLASIANVAAA